jgi:MFS family permease
MSLTSSALYPSRFVSQAGQGLFFGVLVVIGGGASSAALGLSSVLAAMVAGSLLLGAPAGMLIDRIGAARALLLGGMLRLAAIGSAVLSINDPALVVVSAFIYSSASQVFSPAELTLVRWLRPDNAGGAHSVLVALQYAGQGLGVLLAPVLYVLGGTATMLAASAAAYLIVVGLGGFLAVRLRGVASRVHQAEVAAWSDATAYFRREPRAMYAAGVLSFADIATKCLAVALPFYLLQELDLTTLQLSAIVGLGGAGAIAGLVWGARSFSIQRADAAMRLALGATVVSVLALAGFGWLVHTLAHHSQIELVATTTHSLNPGFLVALPAALILGLCFSIGRVGTRAVLSETAPVGAQGKIFAAQSAATDALAIAPILAVGALSGVAGARPGLIIVATLGIGVFAILEWWLPRRRQREVVPANRQPMRDAPLITNQRGAPALAAASIVGQDDRAARPG